MASGRRFSYSSAKESARFRAVFASGASHICFNAAAKLSLFRCGTLARILRIKWISQRKPYDVEFATLTVNHNNKCLARGENPFVSVNGYDISADKIQIPLKDLIIKSDGDNYYLFSNVLKKKLVFHMSTAAEFDRIFMAPFSLPYCYQTPPWTKDPEIRHHKRLQLGNVVIQREHWLIPSSELLQIVNQTEQIKLFYQFNEWRKANGMPERVFVKFEDEPKPIFLSFKSFILVDLIARKVKKVSGFIYFSEMLPDKEELWLRDKRNKRYTSEFRLMYYPLKNNP